MSDKSPNSLLTSQPTTHPHTAQLLQHLHPRYPKSSTLTNPRQQKPRLTLKVKTGKLGQASSSKAIHEVTDSLSSNIVV